MKIVVGLGNPGEEYCRTRHNIGFMVVDRLIKEGWRHDSDFLWRVAGIMGQQVAVIKPMTYMNLSGVAVKKAMSRFDGSISELLVVHDDMDLQPGDMRMRPKGGSGGHRGIESIIYELEDDAFARIKIGIGHPDDRGEVVQYVLEPFDPTEMEVIEEIIPRAVQGIKIWVRQGVRRAMNDFNRTRKKKSEPAPDAQETEKSSFPEGDKGHKEVQ